MIELPFALPDDVDLERRLTEQAPRTVPTLSPFFIENWTPALRALSIQTVAVPLSPTDCSTLRDSIAATWDNKPLKKGDAYWNLAFRCGDAVKAVGGRAFVRLGSRSPKDNTDFLDEEMKPVPVYHGRDALRALSGSERIYLDLSDAVRAGYAPSIFVRRFIKFQPEHEFRCFVEAGKLAGITQYHIQDGPFRWIVRNATAIEAAIRDYLTAAVIPLSGLSDFTVDLLVRDDLAPVLLEINPPHSMGLTYPGLFAAMNLDGSFQFIADASAT